MAAAEKTLWGIHAPTTLDARDLFRKEGVVAIGWSAMGDLTAIAAARAAFRKAIETAYPSCKPGAIPVNAGTLYKFCHTMQIGDYLVYPSKHDRMVNIGIVDGGYEYAPAFDRDRPHVRHVKWIKTLPRTAFSQGALYEIGSAVTLFQVRNFAEEFYAALEGKPPEPPIAEDETVGPVVEDIEQSTRDFFLKTLAQRLKGHPFAEFVAHLLNTMGYQTRVSPEGPDGGIDIIAHRDELGFEPPIIEVQVKSTEGSIGDPVVSALYGKVGANEFGLLVTLGTFTTQAQSFARSKSNLRLIDGGELLELIQAHYDVFDGRYKALLPLRRVLIPGPVAPED